MKTVLCLYRFKNDTWSVYTAFLIDDTLDGCKEFIDSRNAALVQTEIERYETKLENELGEIDRRICEVYIKLLKRDGLSAKFNESHRMRWFWESRSVDIKYITKNGSNLGLLSDE